VEAPVDVLSGLAPPDATVICLLMGRTAAIPADQLAGMYDSADDYMSQYEQATDDMIDAGFAVPEDRDQILDGADPSRIPG
jgi:hypothetical protein